ncbi:glycosyltransferase [Paracoccus sp. SJTW-4]|uniref:glycosyltransferase n=1 Tax=Paracoccus sp. SJTW-4 TaxID=3078428 RepID=UPI0039ED2960
MADQAQVKIYGNPDLPEGPDERPLVTFALFAYNQEKYIREAVEGAFSQTYEPLEIVLSDDCSSDRTFEIMQEMAAAYEGPHQVVVQQNASNLGLIHHILLAARMASGSLIIVAAGDDVSLPSRATKLISHWIASGGVAGVVHSDALAMDESGKTTKYLNGGIQGKKPTLKSFVKNNLRTPIIGATAAYTRNLIIDGPDIDERVFEDKVLSHRALLVGEIVYVPEGLVKYRQVPSSISQQLYNSREHQVKYFIGQRSSALQILSEYIEQVKNHNIPMDTSLAANIIRILHSWDKQISGYNGGVVNKLFLAILRPASSINERVRAVLDSLGLGPALNFIRRKGRRL